MTSKTSLLSPRKRGRKPKHYSEILFELGQRGISITKTRPGEPDPRVSHKVLTFLKYFGRYLGGILTHFLQTGGQQLKCPHCNKILTTSVGLMYHIRLHTGSYFLFLSFAFQFLFFFCNMYIIPLLPKVRNHTPVTCAERALPLLATTTTTSEATAVKSHIDVTSAARCTQQAGV